MDLPLEARVAVLETEMNTIKETTHEIKEQQTEIMRKQDVMKDSVSDFKSEVKRTFAYATGISVGLMLVLKLPEFITWLTSAVKPH